MILTEKIKEIDRFVGTDTDKFNECYNYLISEFPSEKEKKQIDDYIESSLRNLTIEIGRAVDIIGEKLHEIKFLEKEVV